MTITIIKNTILRYRIAPLIQVLVLSTIGLTYAETDVASDAHYLKSSIIVPATTTEEKIMDPVLVGTEQTINSHIVTSSSGPIDDEIFIKQKKNFIFNITGTLLPADTYTKKGLSPHITYTLYGLSLIIGICGVLLIIKKPHFLADKIASIFKFS